MRAYRITVEEYANDDVYLSWVAGYSTSWLKAEEILYGTVDGMQYPTGEIDEFEYGKRGFLGFLKEQNPVGELAGDLDGLYEDFTRDDDTPEVDLSDLI